nr:HK97 family phage prohead protease [Leucobacter ruminantium]
MIIAAGSLNPREPLKRTKLLRDHDDHDPVGFLTAVSDDRRDAEFYLPAGENSDRALEEARNGLRDGLSIGFTVEEYHFDDDDNIVVTRATFHEVSLVACPAFAGAGISASLAFETTPTPKGNPMNREQLAAALAAGTITQAEHDAQLAALPNPAPTAPATPAAAPPAERPGELAGTPQPVPAAAQLAHTAPRPVSLRQLAQDVSAAIARDDRAAVRLALQDTIPADDAGEGFIREDWRGELWQADRTDRRMIDALGTPQPLQTGSKIKGWAWDVKPDVQDYEGNKTAVPSNKPKTKPIEAAVHRSAGGWDIDRIFIDLGEAGFLEAFWRAAVADYKQDSESYAAEQLLAGAFEMPSQPTLLKGLSKLGAGFAAIGASLDAIFIAPDLFEEYSELTQAEVPFWLANATGVSLRNQSATVADLNIRTHPDLAPGQISAFDKRAATWFEKQPPIRVNAIDLPKGGIDLGLFGYDALLINDARANVKMQIGAGGNG